MSDPSPFELERPVSHGRFIPPHGNYRSLLSFQKAEVIYDITYRFCERFLRRGDRTIDQMVQAARSGKQNIVEGCQVSGTSKESEIKLLNVARASLEELLNDYLDYLRVRGHALWEKDSKQAIFVRRLGRSSQSGSNASDGSDDSPAPRPPCSSGDPDASSLTVQAQPSDVRPPSPPSAYDAFRDFVETRPAETVANIAICVIHQANYLLDRQIRAAEADFLARGGIRERMTRARLESRDRPTS